MHTSLSTWVALSALLPSACAFYPYQYNDDNTQTGTDRLRRTTTNDDTRSNAVTLPIRRVARPHLKTRQNAYNIINSKDPTQEDSVAIDQDGNDLSYMVAVTLGDSKEEYHLLLDSAASNTWVMGADCQTDACKAHNTFGAGDSSSLKTTSDAFSITYGSGQVSGFLATDTLHIGPLSPSLTFGLASNVSNEFRSYPMDGILGIGRGVAQGVPAPQVMDVLSSSNLIPAKLYGIHLSRARDGNPDGELNLGEVNKDRFSGDINYVQAISSDTGFWEIPLGSASVDGKNVELSGSRSTIIDSGTSYILMPLSDATALHGLISGSKQDAPNSETFSVPCDSSASIAFTYNNVAYKIETDDWKGGKLASGLCRSNIVGRQTFGENQWLVGDVFLKNVYSVFDFQGGRVGFGVKDESQNTSPDSSSSVSPSSTGASSSSGPGGPGPQQTGSGSSAAAPTSATETKAGQDSNNGGGTAAVSVTLLMASMALATVQLLT